MKMISTSALIAAFMLAATVAHADGWGSVKGKFIYKGSVPSASPVSITKDKEYCGKFKLVDESLVINPKNKGIANVAVMLYLSRSQKKKGIKVHPDAKQATGSAVVDNDECRFDPHMTVVRVGQELLVKNSDTVSHNTKIDLFASPGVNPIVPAKGELKLSFKKPESGPMPISCSIHPWMKGWIIITDHPYVAVSNKDGEFEIKNLPAGKVTLRFWHEVPGNLEKITLKGKKTKLRRGRIEVDIKDGQTVDLGDIIVGADGLK